jgi:luciferase family oxidoreductase group 1
VPLPLSILDLAPVAAGSPPGEALHNTIDLARAAEGWGYHRYWLAEHHNLPAMACPSPEIMIGQVAAATRRIRVGSGGIMLPNHSALRIAEAFQVLEALFPGRIDLGLGRAPGSDPVAAYALRRGMQSSEDFPSQVAELVAFSGGGFPDDHPFRSVAAEPRGVSLPPLWILGSSDFGARMAAALGVGFAFARHMNPRGADEVMHLYREGFRPSEALDEPRAILAVSSVCADTDERAEALASSMALAVLRIRGGRPSALPPPEEAMAYQPNEAEADQLRRYRRAQVVGSPERVGDEIAALVERTAADEVMALTMVHDHLERLRSYELLAGILGPREAQAATAPTT